MRPKANVVRPRLAWPLRPAAPPTGIGRPQPLPRSGVERGCGTIVIVPLARAAVAERAAGREAAGGSVAVERLAEQNRRREVRALGGAGETDVRAGELSVVLHGVIRLRQAREQQRLYI